MTCEETLQIENTKLQGKLKLIEKSHECRMKELKLILEIAKTGNGEAMKLAT